MVTNCLILTIVQLKLQKKWNEKCDLNAIFSNSAWLNIHENISTKSSIFSSSVSQSHSCGATILEWSITAKLK